MRSCLEVRGQEERSDEIVRNDYSYKNFYSVTHKDALSDGDCQGKGTRHGGHTFWMPNCIISPFFDTSNFDTESGGGAADVSARNKHLLRNTYTALRTYSKYDVEDSVATANIE